ncbi:hypothetical protein QU481_10890 [Crenobacter sp. SG2303]|uniref:Four helix bundle protein n=1 Tax=Crenobacter oryzisoli TaxID=3056844 RepID=A0ABT7XNM9_9NEIS|nr:hypothetical protein [Crenobacter sp. SG2303]MDN0075396.1 hypothetical protein [Crenobacter sp. SG2303]
MANSKPKKSKTAKPGQIAKTVELKRFVLAEAACQAVMQLFAVMDKSGEFAEHETARQYAQMASVYYRKIRNGKVLSPADFNASVDLCTAARRALQALDAGMDFSAWSQAEALREVERQTDAVLREYQALITPKAPKV